MTHRKLVAGVALVAAAALTLSACGSTAKKTDTISKDTSLTVGWNQPFYSLNNLTSNGNNTTNANIVYLTSSNLSYYDKDLKVQNDTSFGTYEKTADSPLTVKETFSDKAKWSDGQPVVAADSILAWGAQASIFNTVTDPDAIAKLTNKDGTIKANTGNQVYFDSANPAWSDFTGVPTGDANGKTLTFSYKKLYASWEAPGNLLNPAMPAHIVGKLALGIDDPAKANQAIVDAFKNDDKAALAKISNVWNSSYNFTSMPANKDLLVTDGPYVITDIKDGQYVSLGLNPNYTGDHKPSISKLIVSYNGDGGAQLTDLQNGKVAIIEPQATADLLKNAQGVSNATVLNGNAASWEHIDLTFNNNGPFDPKAYGGDAAKAKAVREAFLLLVPRQEIVDKLIKPLNPSATVRNSFDVTPGDSHYDATTQTNDLATLYPADVPAASKTKAADLLKQAGVKTPVKVRFLYDKSNPRRVNEYQLISASESPLFDVVDNGNAQWSSLLGNGSYDAALFAWQSVSTTLTESQANYVKNGQNNFSGYYNPQVDKLFDQLAGTLDVDQQYQINAQAEKILAEDAFGTTIFQFPDLTIYDKTKVQNVSVSPLSPTYYWNFWQWTQPNNG